MDEMVAILDSLHDYVPTVPANEIVEVPSHSTWQNTEYVGYHLVSTP